MELTVLPQEFSICCINGLGELDWTCEFCFVAKTDRGLSLVCPTGDVPDGALEREDGWRTFRIEGVQDFAMIGVLAEISFLLAEQGINIYAMSTCWADYIMTKEEQFEPALRALEEMGYLITYWGQPG